MPTAALIGSTGLVGSHILSTLLTTPEWTSVTTISRRSPPIPPATPSEKLTPTISPDLASWPSLLPSSPASDVVFSALGTTRAQAGGIKEQWKVDHDANVALVKAARSNDATRTFVFISSTGTRGFASSMAPYSKMKNGVEDAIRDAGFENAIILKPGLIMGEREKSRTGEGQLQSFFRGIGRWSPKLKDAFAQEASVIARAAVRAAEIAGEGKAPGKYWVLEAADILKYGRDEAGEGSSQTPPGATAAATMADESAGTSSK